MFGAPSIDPFNDSQGKFNQIATSVVHNSSIVHRPMNDADNIDLLERYILSDNKQDFFESLVENSDSFFYMKLMDELNKNGLKLPEDIKANLETYTSYSNPKSKKILLKWLLLQIEDESISKDKRQALLHKLNAEYFNFKFEYPKPIHLIDTEKFDTKDIEQIPSIIPKEFCKVFDFKFFLECSYGNNDALLQFGALGKYNQFIKDIMDNDRQKEIE